MGDITSPRGWLLCTYVYSLSRWLPSTSPLRPAPSNEEPEPAKIKGIIVIITGNPQGASL